MTWTAQHKRAFSLVEVVIVIVIIGVIAAIAVPRISRGAKGAGDAAVRGSLAALRNAIDLYSAEHGGALPGADGVEATLKDQLMKKTDVGGNVGNVAGTHIYGPYLRGNGFPPLEVGPNKGASAIDMQLAGPAIDETKTTVGWCYNYKTGDIIANTDDQDENGKTYDKY